MTDRPALAVSATTNRAKSPKLVLASGSPRRRELLSMIGLPFIVSPAEVDEAADPTETPLGVVLRLSQAKAAVVARRYPEALVLAADTTVELDGAMLEKPRSATENREFIARLAGRSHLVHTGHTLAWQGRTAHQAVTSTVTFRALTASEIDWYIATGEGLDKAGGYGIQGFGAVLVSSVCGCYFNVVGLSLATVMTLAHRLGVSLV